MERLSTYEKNGIIKPEQLQQIMENVKITDPNSKISLIVGYLEEDQIIRILNTTNLTDDDLKDEFEKIWKEFIDKKFPSTESHVDLNYIKEQVEETVESHVKDKDKHIIRERLRSRSLGRHTEIVSSEARPTGDKPSSSKVWGIFATIQYFYSPLNDVPDTAKQQTSEVYQKVRDVFKKEMEEIMEGKNDFNKAYTNILLQSGDEVLDQSGIDLSSETRCEMYVDMCEYAIPLFESLAKAFRDQHDPLIYLEKTVKGPLLTQFINQCLQRKAEEGIASMLCAYLERPIREQLDNVIGISMVNLMKDSDPCFSSKSDLKVKVLTDLYNDALFESYSAYLTNVKAFLEKKIGEFTVSFCDEVISNNDENGKTRLQAAAINEVSRLVKVVEGVVAGIEVSDIHEWLSQFFSNSHIQQEIGESTEPDKILVGYDSLDKLNLENFKTYISQELEELKKKLHLSFGKIKCNEVMDNWKTKPYEILEKTLIGCTNQCPFCGEQCDLQDPDHESSCDHRVETHRINCLAGWRRVSNSVMITDVCQAVICTDQNFKVSTNKYHPYKDYKLIHTKWKITPDASSEASLYWKSFVGKYGDSIAEHYKAKPPDFPEEWRDIKWSDIERNLKDLYNIRR